jgi:hypothetical protein
MPRPHEFLDGDALRAGHLAVAHRMGRRRALFGDFLIAPHVVESANWMGCERSVEAYWSSGSGLNPPDGDLL